MRINIDLPKKVVDKLNEKGKNELRARKHVIERIVIGFFFPEDVKE